MSVSVDQTAMLAETFLKDYLRQNEYFTPANELTDSDDDDEGVGDLRLMLTRAVPDPDEPDVIYFFFKFGRVFRNGGDPALSKLVNQCMTALLAAHPEVNQFKHEMCVDPAR
ncbi:hypothetical protein [Myxococcus faecalis]|uniref:hypothetical protein n=1 Tax=Myxococcus faecalis TaxID=3115646 RepID=UPI003CEF245B